MDMEDIDKFTGAGDTLTKFERSDNEGDMSTKLKKNPTKYGHGVSIKQLVATLKLLSEKYYGGHPLVSDHTFDILKEILEERDPKNKFLEQVGAPVKSGKKKIKLPFYTGSLNKKKPDTNELTKWLEEYTGQCIVSDKLDGDSAVMEKRDDTLYLYSRGNGIIGHDISHLIPYLFGKTFIKELPDNDFVIRGELVITEDNFHKLIKFPELKKEGKKLNNARNLVGGLVNSIHIDQSKIMIAKVTDYITYSVFSPKLKPSDQLKWLEKNNFDVVHYDLVSDPTEKYLEKKFDERRKKSEYKIDGLVVVHDALYDLIPGKHPKHAFAYKRYDQSEIADVEVIKVEWRPSQYKYLKPRIIIDPIELSGAEVTYATAFNAQYIVKNNIGPGAIIKITRSGDVIPHILEVIKPAKKPQMPNVEYKWNDTKVDLIVDDDSLDDEIDIKVITNFFKTLGVEHMSSGIITKLYDNGYNTIKKIILAKVSELSDIEGLGKKSATKILSSMDTQLNKVTLSQLMDASGTFGRNFGETRIIAVLEEYPNILDEDWSDKTMINKITEINGIGTVTAKQFVHGLHEFEKFIDHMAKAIDFKSIKKRVPKKMKSTNSVLSGQKIVFTGFRNKNLQEWITHRGGKVSTSVSKNTTLIIASDTKEDSGKLNDARKLNIPIISLNDFIKEYEVSKEI
jgi:DNA ligase (NAD+)